MRLSGTFLLAFLAVLLRHGSALPSCNSATVDIAGADELVFAVIGDWGRVGAQDSMFSRSTVEACQSLGQCCSSLQQPNFPDNFDYSDVLDGPQQRYAASLLNEVCETVDCQFILGMGDNYYPCGADPYSSGLDRFRSDWQSIYQTEGSFIGDLSWYQIVGNHDYGFASSVPLQLEYAKENSKWVFPSDYYSRTFVAGEVSMSVAFLDETPFVGTYAHPTPKPAYFTPYLAQKITPTYINSDAAMYLNQSSGICNIPPANASLLNSISDDATGQIPWLKSCLESSNATWDVVTGHYALYGSDVNWAVNSSKSPYPGNCGGFGSLANLIQEYGVSAYFNGHDHTQTHASPHKNFSSEVGQAATYGNLTYLVNGPNPPTQYFTLGNGGSVQYGDGVTPAQPKSYNNFSDVIYNSNVQYATAQVTDSASYNAAVGEGFAIVTAGVCTMTVQFYNILDYNPGGDREPVHTAVIDKCGPASMPPDASSS